MSTVQEFYERFPYPHKVDDRPSSMGVLPSSFDAIRHHCWAGRWPVGRAFRALVAGGGTGDAAVSLGLSLRHRGIESSIHYVDLSSSSAEIARRRCVKAGLSNVELSVGPIDGVRGEYDYIDLSGVLPIVPDPAELLRHLSTLLVNDGAIGVMAYGRLGRIGVEPFRRIGHALSVGTDVAFARDLLRALPERNWLKLNAKMGQDIDRIPDAEFADRFLAPHEFAYSVSELASMFDAAGLPIRAFIPGLLYDPARILKSDSIRERLSGLPYLDRAQIAEDVQGDFNKHVFYATKKAASPVEVSDFLDIDDAVILPRNLDCAALSAALASGQPVSIAFHIDWVERLVAIRGDRHASQFVAAIATEPTLKALRRSIPNETIQYMSAVLASIEAIHFAVP